MERPPFESQENAKGLQEFATGREANILHERTSNGLLAVPSEEGSPRIIVPRLQILALVLQTHEDIHHQSHLKVLYILKPLFY
jgi:hypothetical protein